MQNDTAVISIGNTLGWSRDVDDNRWDDMPTYKYFSVWVVKIDVNGIYSWSYVPILTEATGYRTSNRVMSGTARILLTTFSMLYKESAMENEVLKIGAELESKGFKVEIKLGQSIDCKYLKTRCKVLEKIKGRMNSNVELDMSKIRIGGD
jgi:hypothetical protein